MIHQLKPLVYDMIESTVLNERFRVPKISTRSGIIQVHQVPRVIITISTGYVTVYFFNYVRLSYQY